MLPKILSENQKQNQNHVKFCKGMLEKIKDNPDILRQIITGDETWVFQYNPINKEAKHAVEDCRITQTQEGVHVKIKNQGHADHFFQTEG